MGFQLLDFFLIMFGVGFERLPGLGLTEVKALCFGDLGARVLMELVVGWQV